MNLEHLDLDEVCLNEIVEGVEETLSANDEFIGDDAA